MSVIVMINPKGGTGKTTSALLLAQALAPHKATALLDCDRNQNLLRWQRGRDNEPGFTVAGATAENAEDVLDKIIELEKQHDIVIVDLEGVKTQTATFALGRAHLALIPIRPSAMEIALAADAIKHVKSTAKVFAREIPFAIVLNRTNAAFPTSRERQLRHELDEASIPLIATSLMQRESYAAMFEEGHTLEEMYDATGADAVRKAIDNRNAFGSSVIAFLRESIQEEANV